MKFSKYPLGVQLRIAVVFLSWDASWAIRSLGAVGPHMGPYTSHTPEIYICLCWTVVTKKEWCNGPFNGPFTSHTQNFIFVLRKKACILDVRSEISNVLLAILD